MLEGSHTLPSHTTHIMNYVKPERSNFRDQWMSNRHREFGFNCPAVDLDCLVTTNHDLTEEFKLLEYDDAEPVALIEYKRNTEKFSLTHPSIVAQSKLATKAELPSFVVVYYPEHYAYYVIGTNEKAKTVPWCAEPKFWTERNFVKMLYHLRGKNVPEEVLVKLKHEKLPEGVEKPCL